MDRGVLTTGARDRVPRKEIAVNGKIATLAHQLGVDESWILERLQKTTPTASNPNGRPRLTDADVRYPEQLAASRRGA